MKYLKVILLWSFLFVCGALGCPYLESVTSNPTVVKIGTTGSQVKFKENIDKDSVIDNNQVAWSYKTPKGGTGIGKPVVYDEAGTWTVYCSVKGWASDESREAGDPSSWSEAKACEIISVNIRSISDVSKISIGNKTCLGQYGIFNFETNPEKYYNLVSVTVLNALVQ